MVVVLLNFREKTCHWQYAVNFDLLLIYYTLTLHLNLLGSTLTPTSVKNTVAVTGDVMFFESKAKINIGVNDIYVMSVESLNSSELNHCCG